MIDQILCVTHDKKVRLARKYTKEESVIDLDEINETTIITKGSKKVIVDKYQSVYLIFVVENENELYILEIMRRLICLLDLCFKRVSDNSLKFYGEYCHMIVDMYILNGKIVENNHLKIVKYCKEHII